MVDGFAPASIVAPLGTVAILCNALIAPLVFHEAFRLRDFTGIVLAAAGAVTIVLSAKTQEEKVVYLHFAYADLKLSPEDIWEAITQTAFLIYFSICCVVAVILVYLSRQVGEKSITIDLGLVAIFGTIFDKRSNPRRLHGIINERHFLPPLPVVISYFYFPHRISPLFHPSLHRHSASQISEQSISKI